ncbi:uncharacterized protein LOC113146548 [Cyclospora cayetanensis]|uniref:Uncharacterized protein LOC113146548 n=1 Tax=Cyclospora cayetanensis TaxID=88456 RepID=A0A6P6RR23_9EIME|nr:uncharacterized protein LOC113146548 [Cyclospora cayetanensis]
MRSRCTEASPGVSPPERPPFRGVGCVRRFAPFSDLPEAARPSLLGVFVDREEAAAAAAAAEAPISAATSAAATLAREAAGGLLRLWGISPWRHSRRQDTEALPGSGGIVVCSSDALLRCSAITGVCCSRISLPATACCCCFASRTALKGPVVAFGCVDGCVHVFSGRTLRLLATLTPPPPTLLATASCTQHNSGRRLASSEAVGARRPFPQIPTHVLLVGNNALLAGLEEGRCVAFFLENNKVAVVYEPPSAVRCFLLQHPYTQQGSREGCLLQRNPLGLKRAASHKWSTDAEEFGSQRHDEGSLSSTATASGHSARQLPVCCLYSAPTERLVVVAVHPEGWSAIPLQRGCSKASSSTPLALLKQHSWHQFAHAIYKRTSLQGAAAAATGAGATQGPDTCSTAASVPPPLQGRRAARCAASSWPLLVFQQHSGVCAGTLWGVSSRVLAIGLGLPEKASQQQKERQHQSQQQQLCCIAITATDILYWRQQGASRSRRALRMPCSESKAAFPMEHATAPSVHLDGDSAAAAAAAHLEQQQGTHARRKGDATECPSFLCGSQAIPCQLAAATPAAAAAAAAGGCVEGVWWSLSAVLQFPLGIAPPLEQAQDAYTMEDATLDWTGRLMVILPRGSSSCCVLSWEVRDGGLAVVPLRLLQVRIYAAEEGHAQLAGGK